MSSPSSILSGLQHFVMMTSLVFVLLAILAVLQTTFAIPDDDYCFISPRHTMCRFKVRPFIWLFGIGDFVTPQKRLLEAEFSGGWKRGVRGWSALLGEETGCPVRIETFFNPSKRQVQLRTPVPTYSSLEFIMECFILDVMISGFFIYSLLLKSYLSQ